MNQGPATCIDGRSGWECWEKDFTVIVGKVLRKVDKECIVKTVVRENGFQNRIDDFKSKLKEIVKSWEIKRVMELYECSESGAIKLIKDADRDDRVYMFCDGEGTGSWKQLPTYAYKACTTFNGQYGYCFIPESPELIKLLKLIKEETDAKRKAELDVTNILELFNSSKKLLEEIPEFKKFVVIDTPSSSQLVSVDTINSVKHLLQSQTTGDV